MTDLTGRTLGDYKIENYITTGGMAAIYQAWHYPTKERVVLKVLLPNIQQQPDLVERFRREARDMAKLQHPHIIPILDHGTLPGNYDFLAMEHAEQGSLDKWIEHHPTPFPPDYASNILQQIALALDYAHQHRVVHRDVKPANILMKEDKALLTDFGIARAVQDSRLTSANMQIGSPSYMSPEQAKGVDVDIRSDVYSLGIVAFEMLTKQTPFQGDTTAIMYQHVHNPPPPIDKVNPTLPRSLVKVMNKALAKDPQKRYSTVGEFAQAFAKALPPPPPSASEPQAQATPTPNKDNTPILVAGLAIAIVVVMMFLVMALNNPTEEVSLTSEASTSVSDEPAEGLVVDFTPTDTPTPQAEAPELLSPDNGETFSTNSVIRIEWAGPRLSGSQGYWLNIRNENNQDVLEEWRTVPSYNLAPGTLPEGNYQWMVLLVSDIDAGSIENELSRSSPRSFSIGERRIPTPTFTPSPTPTPTPTPRPNRVVSPPPEPQALVSAVTLQEPYENQNFVGRIAKPTFSWTPADYDLGTNDYYVLIINHRDGEERIWLKNTSYLLPDDKIWLIERGPEFTWQVVLARQVTGEANENPQETLSYYSQLQSFRWAE